MNESRSTKIKRLKMRSMRRGIKELDLLLDKFANAHLDLMPDEQLNLYDQLLQEHDLDIFQWLIGRIEAPMLYHDLVNDIMTTNNTQ